MKVLISTPGEVDFKFSVDVPVWHLELFWKDPEEYLAPFLARFEDASWESIG